MNDAEKKIMEIWFSQVVLTGYALDDFNDEPYWVRERERWQARIAEPWAELAELGWKVGVANDWFRFLLKSVDGLATSRLLEEMVRAGVVDIAEVWHPELDGLGEDEPKWKADFPIEHLPMTDMAREILGIPEREELKLLAEYLEGSDNSGC